MSSINNCLSNPNPLQLLIQYICDKPAIYNYCDCPYLEQEIKADKNNVGLHHNVKKKKTIGSKILFLYPFTPALLFPNIENI